MTDAEITEQATALLDAEGRIEGTRWKPYKGHDWQGAVQAVCNGNPFTDSKRTRSFLGESVPPALPRATNDEPCLCHTLFACMATEHETAA